MRNKKYKLELLEEIIEGRKLKQLEKRLLENSGIYKIRASRQFKRLRGKIDILYIGLATKSRRNNLLSRLLTFPNGFEKMQENLPFRKRRAIKRFWKLKKRGFQLYFSYSICKTASECVKKEKDELKKFEQKHLELPPLNHSN